MSIPKGFTSSTRHLMRHHTQKVTGVKRRSMTMMEHYVMMIINFLDNNMEHNYLLKYHMTLPMPMPTSWTRT